MISGQLPCSTVCPAQPSSLHASSPSYHVRASLIRQATTSSTPTAAPTRVCVLHPASPYVTLVRTTFAASRRSHAGTGTPCGESVQSTHTRLPCPCIRTCCLLRSFRSANHSYLFFSLCQRFQMACTRCRSCLCDCAAMPAHLGHRKSPPYPASITAIYSL